MRSCCSHIPSYLNAIDQSVLPALALELALELVLAWVLVLALELALVLVLELALELALVLALELALVLVPESALVLALELALALVPELALVLVLESVPALVRECALPERKNRTLRNSLESFCTLPPTPCRLPCLYTYQDTLSRARARARRARARTALLSMPHLACHTPCRLPCLYCQLSTHHQYPNDFEEAQSGRCLRKLPFHQFHEYIPCPQYPCKPEQIRTTTKTDTWWLGKSRQLK
jgi:hypothetical protein